MIYIALSTGNKCLVLEPQNLEDMKEGEILYSPDKSVAVLYTPDAVWLGKQIKTHHDLGTLNAEVFDRLHEESLERPVVMDREAHRLMRVI